MTELQIYEKYCQNKPRSESLWRQCSDCAFFQVGHAWTTHTHIYIPTHARRQIHTHTHTRTCTNAHRDTDVDTHKHGCTKTYKYTHKNIYLHADTHHIFNYLYIIFILHQECQKKLEHKLGLDSYLLKPVQRITKYQLLLKVHLSVFGP